MIEINDLRQNISGMLVSLKKNYLFFRDKSFQVSITSTLLGETSPLSFPHINGLLKLGQAGESLFSILTSPL